jgi:hypothetical protein
MAAKEGQSFSGICGKRVKQITSLSTLGGGEKLPGRTVRSRST